MPTPNVIVILADDLGFSDAASFGGEISTPGLDRLAERGTRMSSFYVTPRCSPSRAALLTGMHPHSVGIGILTSDDRPRGYPGALDSATPTLAERLKGNGYATALAGKWHLSSDTEQPNATWPTRRGFDEFHGILPGCGSYYQPRLYRDEDLVSPQTFAGDYYFTDDITTYASDFITRSAHEERPFFLYLAYTAPHWPLHAREEDIAAYRDLYSAGWDALRTARFERQRDLDLDFGQSDLPARDDKVDAWEDAEEKEWEIERMAVYAAQVTAMDRGIGQVLDTLSELGIDDDTLVIFSSDNGACAEELGPHVAEKFGEDMTPRHTRAGVPVRFGNDPSVLPGAEDTYASYGRAWANLSNTPFRLYKRWVHEGGIASPFIASWPAGGIDQGALVADVGHVIDVAPTILEAVGDTASLPGTSLLPALQLTGRDPDVNDRPLFWEHVGNAAIRRGRWKLVREALSPWELYEIRTDRAEMNDLAQEHPEIVRELADEWGRWAVENGVLHWEDVLDDYRRRGLSTAGLKR